jgi:hypothetical protein
MGTLQPAAGGPQLGRPDATYVQTTLMPPAAVSVTLKLRYDASERAGSVGITVKDRSDGSECAMVALPFRRNVTVQELLAEAVERIDGTLELVLNPDPF